MRLVASALLVAGALPMVAQAQAYQCAVPQGPVSVPSVERDGPVRETPVTGYTLALSWSPEYCRTRQNSARDRQQCSGENGRFGFIVHGLWPDGRGGQWPQWCPTRRVLAPAEARRNLCMTPSVQLLADEWAKHGACMVATPEGYFQATRILWSSLRWPDYDRLSRRDDLTAGDVRRAFVAANPGWKVSQVGLVLNERGWLKEMRLCYGRDFRPRDCEGRRFGPGDSTAAKIWRGL